MSTSSSISPDDRALVEGFWGEFVDGYIFNDLNNCVKAGANYLVALGEMCYIDFLGKLMTGEEGSRRNFRTFVTTYLSSYAEPAFLEDLYGEFRSGLVHAYFPENVYVVAVMTATPSPPSIWREAGKWKIVVADFIPEFRAAADALKKDLMSGKYLAAFKKAVSENPGLDKIANWPVTAGASVASTTVTTFSGSVVSQHAKPPEE